MNDTFHVPVMLGEVIEALQVEKGKRYIDATVGGGGHGWEIIKRGGVLLGIDQDPEAVEFAKQNVKYQMSPVRNATQSVAGGNVKLKDTNWKIVQGNFRDIKRLAEENGFSEIDGILFDLGVSSHQLDTPERGFSYRFSGAPLDMRLDQSQGITAREILQAADEEELYEIFAKYGEEEHSRTIAHAFVRARQVSPITTSGDLEKILHEVARGSGEKHKMLSRIYQALRIVVNDEFDDLKNALSGVPEILKSGGRLVVISFHSLEDRIVKNYFLKSEWENISKKPITAKYTEVLENKRARSAKMRIAQKI